MQDKRRRRLLPAQLFVTSALHALPTVAIFANLAWHGSEFREVFFDAGADATLAALNSGTLRLDIGCTYSRRPALLRHRDGCGKQHRSADYYEALHHSHLLDKPFGAHPIVAHPGAQHHPPSKCASLI
jgi:hypothetical protein